MIEIKCDTQEEKNEIFSSLIDGLCPFIDMLCCIDSGNRKEGEKRYIYDCETCIAENIVWIVTEVEE